MKYNLHRSLNSTKLVINNKMPLTSLIRVLLI